MEKSEIKKPALKSAVTALATVIAVILISIRTILVLESALVLGAMTAAVFALFMGLSWHQIEKGMISGIKNAIGASLILIIIGMVIGSWILSGTIQTMIYYGLNFLSPGIFLPAAFILAAITSILIGSSFGTIATMGIVLLGVAEGLGVPKSITVGAIVSGAMLGDKISPMSDSTNLTAAMSSTDLFEHIKSMLYISVPSALISLIIYSILGASYLDGGANLSQISMIMENLSNNFNISLWTLIPPALMLLLSLFKMPAIASLSISFVTASIFAFLTQGATFAEVLNAAANGYQADTGMSLLDNLLTQGGINNMMSTVAIIMAGTAMGGILEKARILEVLLESMLKVVKKPRDLILISLTSAYVMLLATGEMFVSIVIPGRTLAPAYQEMDINTNVLSRSLETASTLGCSILPWGVVSVYIQNVMDIGFSYIPYTFLSFLAPIIAVIYAYTGKFIFRSN
ncbi:transporter, NhaC family [Halanaerobium congolense]|uniref:Transporter, NhaC family n=1 Tax=Halanaerobium congolense TaxID=54121 RepID=A0A1I0AHM7_9FIRM|nr:Na+/H+ antiporter NhaC [Halanaerobium congolense]PTX17440.1 transporter (NhaC family) [Halanaerobium congolense]SDF44446.1 transporter, NhaC family [Halanaerobium congolense]SES93791.1 transporter, NhaC family [Halanaerobium congolense]SFP25082.1 transporter, NhaC family [Halanaerobium congolense]